MKFHRKRLGNAYNPTHKKIVYTVTVHQCGGCEKNNTSWNWVLVPKIPEDYTIEFKVCQRKTPQQMKTIRPPEIIILIFLFPN